MVQSISPPFTPHYPWLQGEPLFANELNAAIANAGHGAGIRITDWIPGGQPDGVTDLSLYFQEAIDNAANADPTNRAAAPGLSALIVPANSLPYIIGSPGLVIPSHSHIIIETGATLKIANGANASMLAFVDGATNVLIELRGSLDGNAGNQTFDTGGTGVASGGIVSLGICSNILIDGSNRQGLITNFWNWPVNIVKATNVEVRGVQLTNSGNSCEFAGISTRVNVISGSYNAGSGALSLTTDVAHNIAAGQTFTYAAAATPQAFLQGEFIATSVTPTTVNATIRTGQPGTGSWSGAAGTQGRVGTCTRCYNVGFVNCFYRDIRDIPLCLYSGCNGSYIRDCEGIGGPLIFADAAQPASCIDCEILGCWCHDSSGSGPGIASNLAGLQHHNCRVFDNIVANNQGGGILISAADGVDVYNNYIHDNGPRFDVSGYSSQLQIGGTVTRADIRGNTIRNPGQGIVASFVTSTVGGTYSNTSGAVSLITAATHNIPVGGTFTTANMFGTGGGNFLGLNGTQIATAGTTGTTLNYTAAPGLGTINIGTSHASAGRISTVTYAVASHIVAGTYTSDSSGNISLTTDVPHGFVSGNRFVLGSVLGPTVPLGGEFTATTGTAGTTLNFVTAPSTSFVVTSGRVMPANYGITVEGSDFCRVTGNRVGDYQKPTLLTAAIGGAWGDSGISEGNYFGPRSAVDPDVSFYGSGSQGSSYDAMFGFAVANSSIAGLVTFEGATQQSGGMPAYLPPQGLTPGWNRSRGQGEVNFYLGRGAGAPGGFNFLQVAVIHITSGSYTAATGIVSVTTSLPHGVIPGGAFVIRSATGTDSNDGDDIAHLNGGHIANSDTTGSTLTFTIRLNLTISSITGGTVVPSGAGGGLIDITAGSGGMLFSVDGHGNATIPGTLSVGGAVTGGGGSYLPLSGGIHSIAESGAVGDGTTDDQPAIQAWLNTLTAGAEVLLQPGKWYYIHAATLTIPPHITVRGAYSSKDSQIVAGSAAFLAAGGFFIDPALPAGIIMAGPSSLRQVKVYRAGLVGGVSNAQATTDYATWAAEGVYQPTNGAMTGGATVIPLASTTGITVGMQVTGLGNLGPLQGAAWTPSKVIAINPGVSVTISAGVATAIASGTWFRFGQSIGIVISRASAGVTIDDCVIIGFRTGIQTFPGQFGITRTIGDSITNVECVGGGDFAVIRDCEFMPLYGNPPNTNYSRAGDGIFYHDCAGPSFFNCYVIGWKISWHIENSAFWGQFCGGEVVTDGGPGLVNWYIRGGGAARLYDCNAQAGGIGYHIDGANDLYMSDCTSSGSQVTTANNTAHFLVENALAVGNMFLTINCPSTLGGYPSKVPLKMGAGTVNAFSFNNPTIFDLAATPTVPFVQGNLPPTFTPKFSSGIVYRGSRTTGGTTPIVQYWNGIIFDGAGTLATHTITLPPYPMDGQNVDIFFNIGITALTYATTDGALIGAYNNPNAGERVRLAYSAAQNTWFVGGRGVPGTIKYTRLFTSLSVIGNGADLTEDTLVSYTIPANTLVNVGDALRIVASGAFIGSTDAKTARIRIGGITSGTPTTTAATSTTWRVELNVTRAALNTQEYEYFGAISGAAGTQLYNNAQSSLGDASPATLTVTGQNTTNSVASSVTVRTVTVDLIRA